VVIGITVLIAVHAVLIGIIFLPISGITMVHVVLRIYGLALFLASLELTHS